jgi:hypothetical protein
MKNPIKFSLWLKGTTISILAFLLLPITNANDDIMRDHGNEFHLDGKAHRRHDGTISLTIINRSPDGCDYLIAHGDIIVDNLPAEDDPINVMKTRIDPVIAGGGQLTRVAASAAGKDLLLAEQMMRCEFRLPKKWKNTKIDSIEIKFYVCKTPITQKKIRLTRYVIQLPVRPQT